MKAVDVVVMAAGKGTRMKSRTPKVLHRLAGRVLELPVLIALARIDRARIPTAHRDHHVRFADYRVLEPLRALGGDVGPELAHRLDDHGIEPVGRLAPGREDANAALGLASQGFSESCRVPGVDR